MQQMEMNYDLIRGEIHKRQILQVLLLLIISATVLVAGIGDTTLTDQDESRYTLISKNMIERHDYMEPWLGDAVYKDKPPLYFWLTAGSLKLFGEKNLNFSARIVPVVGGILTVLATYLIASALFNHMIGIISGGCLLSTVALIGFGKFVRMDIYLTAFIALAIWAFIKGYKTGTKSRWYLLIYPLIALGVLTKGPVGFLPLVIVLIYLFWQRNWVVIGNMRLMFGIAVIIAMAGPWFLYMQVTHPGYAYSFFVQQNIGRFWEGLFGHLENPLIYVAALLVGLVPWSGLFVLAFGRYFRQGMSRSVNPDWESRLLLIWLLFVVVFFSFSRTKLVPYILPAYIPAAIFVGRFMYDYQQSDFPRRRRQLSFAWAYPMVFLVGIFVVGMFVVSAFGSGWIACREQWSMDGSENVGSWWWIFSLVYRLVLAGVLVKVLWYLWRNWQLPQLVTAIGTAFLILIVDLSYTDLPRVAELCSCRSLVPVVVKHTEGSEKIIAGPEPRWSLPLYVGNERSVRQIDHLANLTDYVKHPGEIVYLSTDDDSFVQAKGIMRNRVKVLAEYKDTRLLLINPVSIPLAQITDDGAK